jgi:hypothetical protein
MLLGSTMRDRLDGRQRGWDPRRVGWSMGEVSYVKTPRGHIAYRVGGTDRWTT